MENKITVLVPAYNAESTIARTLASLDAQLDNRFNVIVCSDGSTDGTNELARNWCMLRDNTSFYENRHMGVGATREKLYKECETEYFIFLDADDVLYPYATKLINEAINSENDIYHFYFYRENDSDLTLYTEKIGLTWTHGKVYKREFINRYGITFDPKLKTGEDSYVNAICYELADYKVIDIPIYIWCNNANSITRSIDYDGLFGLLRDNVTATEKSLKFVARYKEYSSIKFVEATLVFIEKNVAHILNSTKYTELQKTLMKESYDSLINTIERVKHGYC